MQAQMPLAEHSAPTKEPLSDEYDPTPEERKLCKKIDGLFDRYRRHRNQYDAQWMEDYKFFLGKQWKGPRPSYRHTEVINLVWQVIQSQIPILTDAKPRVDFLPRDPTDREFVGMLNEMLDADWETNNWLYQLTELLYDGAIYGTGIADLCYNKDLRFGAGDIDFSSQEIFYIYPDPDAKDVNKDSRGFIRARPMSVADVARLYPEKGKYVKADVEDLLDRDKNVVEPLRYSSATDRRQTVETEGNGQYAKKPDKVMLIEAYYFDDEMQEEEKQVEGEDGAQSTVFEQRLKYPRGRYTVKAGDVLLKDGPNPYDDGKFPFLRYTNYILPREFFGESEIAPVRGPQRIANKIYSFMLDVLTLTGNPIWIMDSNSGVNPNLLTNAPGQVVEKNPGTDVHRESGTQLQPYIMQMFDKTREIVDQISGAQDVSRGLPPGGVTAASAISSLQNAAQTRLRQKSRNIDALLQNFGRMYCSRVMQFYSAPRVFRYTNNDGAQKYFRAYVVDKDTEAGTIKAMRVQRFDENGQPMPEINEYELRGEIDIKVTTGTALPFAKGEVKQEMLGLLDRGVIDRQEYFKQTDFPNWEAVEDRMKQREAQQAQAQAQQGQRPA
jgi:hypothetical protein